MMEFAVGSIIEGRYQLDEPIGEGGMGVVWGATHAVTHKRVALKFLKSPSSEATKRFLREAKITGLLGHPNIVDVHDVFQLEGGTLAMVMELLKGETLAARLERVKAIAPGELAALMLPVVSAVGAAHALGVVHRDLKPENIFLATDPLGHTIVKVLDFGIAKLTPLDAASAGTGRLTSSGAVMGTPYYMAPEQVGGETVDQRADVWALGVILYECLSGCRPFDGENFGQIFVKIATKEIPPVERLVPGIPAHVARLVGRMLARNRDERPFDLREVFAALSDGSDTGAVEPFGATFVAPISSRPTPASFPDPSTPYAALGQSTQTLPVSTSIRPPAAPRRGASSAIVMAGAVFVAALSLLVVTGFKLRSSPSRTASGAALAVSSPAVVALDAPPTPAPSVSLAQPVESLPSAVPSARTKAAPPRPSVRAPSAASTAPARSPVPPVTAPAAPAATAAHPAEPDLLFNR